MKDDLNVVEMLRAHNVTAEVQLKKLLNTIWEKTTFDEGEHGVVKIFKKETGKVSLYPML